MKFRYVTVLVFSLLTLSLPNALGQFGAISISGGSTAPKTDHSERSLAAIDLAIQAAESGIMDVSVEAMKRAVTKGPPVKSIDLGGLLSRKPRTTTSSRSRSAQQQQQQQQAETARMQLSKRLMRLHAAWSKSELDSVLAYQSWKELVLPSGRPNEAFAYSVEPPLNRSSSYSSIPFDYEEPESAECGAEALVEWARKADRLDDLRSELTKREKLPGAASTVMLMKVILAQDKAVPLEEVEALCEQLESNVKLLTSDPNSKLLMSQVWAMLKRMEEGSAAKKSLIFKVIESVAGNPQWPRNAWLEFLVAKRLREAIASGDQAQFDSAFALTCSRYDPIRANNSEYIASQEARAYSTAAQRAFDAGKSELGIYCLRTQSNIVTDDRYGTTNAAFLDVYSSVGKHMRKLSPQQRGTLLNDLVWNMSTLGLRRNSKMKPTFNVPDLFISKVDQSKLTHKQISGENSLSMSVLEWAMRDALSLGKEDEILKRIAEKESQGSDDAKLAKLVFQMAKNEPIDISLLKKDGKFQTVLGNDQSVLPLDIEIARLALQDEKHQEEARKHIDRLIKICEQRHLQSQMTWLRHLRHQDLVAQGKAPTTHHSLKHWHVADDVSAQDYAIGNVPETAWVRRSETGWGLEFGTQVSYLLLRYPIEGDCKITLRAKDGLYQEMGAMLDGIVTEFFEYETDLRSWGVGNRGVFVADTDAMVDNEFNTYQFLREGDKTRIIVGDDKFETKIESVTDAFPFFGLCCYGYRVCSFDSLQIEGDVRIPREVKMLSPSLLGWSAKFRQQRLHNITDANVTKDQPIDRKQVDWLCIDGVCESVDHSSEEAEKKKNDNQKRKEGLLQYLRPIEDGEEVAFEFYHEEGKYSLSPALGRIALDLSKPEKIGLHWITADSGGQWTRVWARNRAVDTVAEQLAMPELKNEAWNTASIRLSGDQLTLQINGTDVYRRVWEPKTGRLFGLFHDPTKFHVRVRNVSLTGDWPETLPADLFEEKT